VDDVILGVSRRPAVLLVVLYGLRNAFGGLGSVLPGSEWIDRIIWAVIAITLTHWAARLFVDVLVYYVKEFAEQTEAIWDDVLVPVLERIGAPLIYIIGLFFALQFLGLDLTGLWVAVGGGAFVLAFALQGILSDFFAGLILLVDTPFRTGDVIVLPDTVTKGKNITAVVRSIGIRMTHLFNVQNYTDMYIPNGALARSTFFNANRPTTNLAATVGFAAKRQGTNPNKVMALLREAVLAHPDIIGDPIPKLNALSSIKGLKKRDEAMGTPSKKRAAHNRLRAEVYVNRQLDTIRTALHGLIAMIREMELGGLDAQEVANLSSEYDKILSMVGLSPLEQTGRRRHKTHMVEDDVTEDSNTLLQLLHNWLEVWLTDPNLFPDDREILHGEWDQKIRFLSNRLASLYDVIHNPAGQETRVDDMVQDLVNWLDDSFKRTKVMWQEPQVWLTAFNNTFIGFNIRYYVDNIRLEHWRRPWRVESELTKDVMRRFKIEGVKLPKAMYRSGDESTEAGVFIT
jgi:MscS family membrane protein